LTLFSMWLGFFAWYRGLALGGTVRVSQVQLVQPFLALLFAVPVLGERLDATTVFFSLAVIATVFVGKKMPADIQLSSRSSEDEHAAAVLRDRAARSHRSRHRDAGPGPEGASGMSRRAAPKANSAVRSTEDSQ